MIVRYRCDRCGYTTDSAEDGRCPCEERIAGVEVACAGALVREQFWCAGCRSLVPALFPTSNGMGPLCHGCADRESEATVRIPRQTLAEVAAEWRAMQEVA